MDWSAFFPDIAPHVKQCPSPVIEHELLRAAQKFYKGSRAWRVMLQSIAVSAGNTEITVSTGNSGTSLVRVEEAWYDNRPIDIMTVEDLDKGFADDWTLHTGQPTAITQIEAGIVRLYPIPVSASIDGLKLRISIMPSDTATGISDLHAPTYRDAIVGGAKSRLLDMPDYPWTNEAKASFLAQKFDDDIADARYKAAQAFGRGRLRAHPKWC